MGRSAAADVYCWGELMFEQDVRQAALFAKKAFESMATNGVPATPPNYQLWYSYHVGQNADLVDEINAAAKTGRPVDGEACASLVQKFVEVEDTSELVSEITDAIGSVTDQARDSLKQAGEDAERFSESLAGFSGEVADHNSDGDLQKIIQNMIAETKEMVQRTIELETQLSESSQEIASLKSELESTTAEARTDMLTGIGNRMAFQSFLCKAVADAEGGNDKLSLIIGDVDHFKSFNDRWGHPFGDQVLKLISFCIEQLVPETGLAARYGGEEFAIVLPETHLDEAVQLAEQIRRDISSKRIRRTDSGEDVGQITVSFGVAQFSEADSSDDLISRADQALYDAKNSGRNQVKRAA